MFKRLTLLLLCAIIFGACTTVYCDPVPITPTVEVTEEVTATETPSVETTPTLITSTPTNTPTARPTNTLQPTHTPQPTSTPNTSTDPRVRVQGRTRHFYNINGQGLQDYNELMRHTDAVDPATVTVMDNFGLAVEFAKRGIITVVRSYSRFEGGQCLQDDPANQVRRFRDELNANQVPNSVRQYMYYYGCSNEPSYGQNNTVEQILAMEIRGMLEADKVGVHVCSGNWGVGNFNPSHVDAGIYDEYLRVLIRGNHLLCVHEYTSLTLAFGVGTTMSRADLLDPTRVQTNNWATLSQIQPQRIQLPVMAQSSNLPFGYAEMWDYYTQPTAQAVNGVLPPYWHLFRVYWLFIRAKEIGLEYPYVIITEGLHDHLDDINREEPRALQILDDRFGMPEYDDLRGAPSHCRLWEQFYYPNQSCEQSYMQQLLWWDSIAHKNILGVSIFTWSYHDGWKSFNLASNQSTMNIVNFRRLFEACYGVSPHCTFQS